MLNEKALEAAKKAVKASAIYNPAGDVSSLARPALEAYFRSIPSSPVSELVERLREACVGHPHAKIAWPHRLLHEAADRLIALEAENAQLRPEMGKASREKFYYPIVMPVNSEGQGPADLRDAVKLTWEVWDQEMMSHGSFDFLIDAVDLANELNARRVREGGKVDG